MGTKALTNISPSSTYRLIIFGLHKYWAKGLAELVVWRLVPLQTDILHNEASIFDITSIFKVQLIKIVQTHVQSIQSFLRLRNPHLVCHLVASIQAHINPSVNTAQHRTPSY